jgi:hypothetical protein
VQKGVGGVYGLRKPDVTVDHFRVGFILGNELGRRWRPPIRRPPLPVEPAKAEVFNFQEFPDAIAGIFTTKTW